MRWNALKYPQDLIIWSPLISSFRKALLSFCISFCMAFIGEREQVEPQALEDKGFLQLDFVAKINNSFLSFFRTNDI